MIPGGRRKKSTCWHIRSSASSGRDRVGHRTDPTYQDLRKRLFQDRKLIKKHNFDLSRFTELQKHCNYLLDAPALTKQKIGTVVESEDAFH